MKFKPYPSYKDSGIEWLGEVPEHWDIQPIKYVIDKIESGTSVNATDEPATDNEIGVLKTSCVYSGQFNPFENKTVITEEIDRVSCPLKIGVLIVSRMNTPDLVGAAGLVATAPTNLFLPDRLWQISFLKANSTYVYYWTQSTMYRAFIKSVCSGTSSSMQNLSQDQFRSFVFPSPDNKEQSAIANFLDRETLRIDELVEEKIRFIELLKEKRQSLISHVVTKGLDPTVKMKDSGVDWLGEVPEHWGIKRIKHLCEIRKRIAGKEGYPVLSITQRGIKVKDTISGEGQLAMDYSKYQFVEIGDFAMNHMDLLTGYVDLSNFHGVTSPDYRVFTLTDKKSIDRYFLYLMQMGYKNKIFYSYGQGVANIGRWRLQTDSFNNFSVPYPNKKEQQQIVDFLDAQTTKIDTLITETQQSITLLKEHRTALISAAVTGKIDVREAA